MAEPTAEPHDLRRFITAQDPLIEQVERELRAGRKSTHWMWFIFPQIAGLGRSETSRFYALSSRDEAAAYLADPVLGARLVRCTRMVNDLEGNSAEPIFGGIDAMKFHSCVTLFAAVAPDRSEFASALQKYFRGEPDRATLDLI